MMELDAVRQNLIQMGETTISLFEQALRAVQEPNPDLLAAARELEAQTDQQHQFIHDQCLNLITLQAPVARDARLVTGVLDAIVDLELIGDYSYEIAALSSAMRRRPPTQVLAQVSEAGAKIREALTIAIDSWRNGAHDQGLSVRPKEPAIRAECEVLYEKLSQLTSVPGDAAMYVDLMLVSRHLERILRHAVFVAERAAGAAPANAGTA